MTRFSQYYGQFQTFGGGFSRLPDWARIVVGVAALPGIVLFWWMMRTGLVDAAMGTAGGGEDGDHDGGHQAARGD